MKLSRFFISAMFIAGCATGVAVRDLVVTARAQGQPAVAYQYTFVNFLDVGDEYRSPEGRNTLLNRYGREGWRLSAADGPLLYFERSFAVPPPSMRPPASAPRAPGGNQ